MTSFNELDNPSFIFPESNSLFDQISDIDQRYALKDVLSHKLENVPAGVISKPRPQGSKLVPSRENHLTTTQVLNHEPDAVNLPHIPPDLRLDFLFANRHTIDEHGCLAIKDPQHQRIDITRAIFFWRLDEQHQFQRFHDHSRWNLALFIALLTKELCDADGKPEPPLAHDFAVGYLAAVLEHHHDPANFDKREAFIKMWKDLPYEFFTFKSAQKMIMKHEMKRLTKEWNEELARIKKSKDLGNNKGEIERAYDAKVAKFVGTLVPGHVDNRGGPGIYRTPAQAIEELKFQSDIRADTLPEKALLNALTVRASDYLSVPSNGNTQPEEEAPAEAPPMKVPIFGFHSVNPDWLNAQDPYNKRKIETDWPANHFPKPTRADVNKNAKTIVPIKDGIRVLKASKPKEMLAKLMALFPQKVPVKGPPRTGLAVPTITPIAAEPPKPLFTKLPTYEGDMDEWIKHSLSFEVGKRKRGDAETDGDDEPDRKRARV